MTDPNKFLSCTEDELLGKYLALGNLSDSPFAQRKMERAAALLTKHGDVDGIHHLRWVIDQALRELCGDEETYEALLAERQRNGSDDPDEQLGEWEIGRAP